MLPSLPATKENTATNQTAKQDDAGDVRGFQNPASQLHALPAKDERSCGSSKQEY